MLTKIVLEVPIQAVSGLHKFCEDHDVRICSAEFVQDRKAMVRLTEDQKLEIAGFRGQRTAPDLAEAYNVTTATIYRIWGDLT